VNWGAFWATVSAFLVSGATNEFCDIAPWLAKRVLRRAARIEAANQDEESLILDELLALLDEVPGKISKLVWSLGRLGFSWRFAAKKFKLSLRKFLDRSSDFSSPTTQRVNVIVSLTLIAGASIMTFATSPWWLLGGIVTTALSGMASILQMYWILKKQEAIVARRKRH
jgi:hypothetical protein